MAAKRVEVRPNVLAARKLGRTPLMEAALQRYADSVLEAAKRAAPRGDSGAGEGYADQLDAVVGSKGRGGTLIGRVNANKFTSHFVEFGTETNRPFAPLRRALEAVGFRVFRRRR